MKHSSEKGETLEVELPPVEAVSAFDQLPTEVTGERRTQHRAPEVQDATTLLRKIGAQNRSTAEIRAFVDAFVAAVETAGAGNLLPEIISELEMHGLYDIALAVKQHIRPSGGKHEPPLTIT